MAWARVLVPEMVSPPTVPSSYLPGVCQVGVGGGRKELDVQSLRARKNLGRANGIIPCYSKKSSEGQQISLETC